MGDRMESAEAFGEVVLWQGDRDRPLGVYEYCDCATCQADKTPGAVAYLSASTPEGFGISVEILDERVADRLRETLG